MPSPLDYFSGRLLERERVSSSQNQNVAFMKSIVLEHAIGIGMKYLTFKLERKREEAGESLPTAADGLEVELRLIP